MRIQSKKSDNTCSIVILILTSIILVKTELMILPLIFLKILLLRLNFMLIGISMDSLDSFGISRIQNLKSKAAYLPPGLQDKGFLKLESKWMKMLKNKLGEDLSRKSLPDFHLEENHLKRKNKQNYLHREEKKKKGKKLKKNN